MINWDCITFWTNILKKNEMNILYGWKDIKGFPYLCWSSCWGKYFLQLLFKVQETKAGMTCYIIKMFFFSKMIFLTINRKPYIDLRKLTPKKKDWMLNQPPQDVSVVWIPWSIVKNSLHHIYKIVSRARMSYKKILTILI